MALHEQSAGKTDEWYTPAYVFEAMGQWFDLDPAPSPHWSPSWSWCRNQDYPGLESDWYGRVWLNPPFGGRNGVVPWLERFFDHGNGVALVPDRTSAPWWQRFAPMADAILFVSPKIRFIGAAGKEGTSPAQGTTLLAAGVEATVALKRAEAAGLGKVWVRP